MTLDSKLTVVSWNLDSLHAKRANMTQKPNISIESWFDLMEPTIVAFQETYWSNSMDELKLKTNYQHIPAVSDVNGARSLSLFLHPSVARLRNGIVGDKNLFCQ